MTTLIVAFRNFASAPKNERLSLLQKMRDEMSWQGKENLCCRKSL